MTGSRGGVVLKIIIGVVIFAIISIAGVAWMIHRGLQKARSEFPKMMEARLQELEKGKNIAPVDLALLRELKTISEKKETTMTTIGMIHMVGLMAASDDAITTNEHRQMVELRDLAVSKKGDIGIKTMQEFLQKHPEMKAAIEEAQKKGKH